jgi:lipoprotein-anchoring transpeptidase ErfK/SrfK
MQKQTIALLVMKAVRSLLCFRTLSWWGLLGCAALPLLLFTQQGDASAGSGTRAAKATPSAPSTRVRVKAETTIYWTSAAVRPRRAIVASGGVVELDGGRGKSGPGCRADWLPVAGGGFLCSDTVEPTKELARAMPPLVDGLLPFVFVHRLESKAFSYAFLPGDGANKSRLLRRGKVLDESRYKRHTPSRFRGRDLEHHPLPNRNLVPGWAVADATPVYASPSASRAPVMKLDRHTPVLVGRRPAAQGWRQVRNAEGDRTLGFVPEDGKVRYWVEAAPVPGLADGETWLDIDVGQQMIALRTTGAGPVYVTLVSSGLAERPSPLGVYHLQHKLAYRSMGNLPDSADQYFIENVPWAMYFLPNFAIHGAYWHDEFGNRRSHGCVNLAPRDARYIYDRVPPRQQPGFFKTFASDRAPGAVVRLRDSTRSVVSRGRPVRGGSHT